MDKIEMLKKRIMACFIDCVLIGSIAIMVHLPLAILRLPSLINSFFSIMIFLFFGFLLLAKDGPTWAIGPLMGQSPGKKVVGLIVTKLDGKTNISFAESIKRNLPLGLPYAFAIVFQIIGIIPLDFIRTLLLVLGFLGFLISIGIIGLELLAMYKDPDGRRWGDHQAMTKVVPFN